MEVYTHRGIGLGPENTHVAYRAAADLRVGIEADVGKTRNGTFVMLHDATLDRTTSGTGLLSDKTDAEIAFLSAGAGHDEAYANERIPLCEDVLARYGRRVQLILDIKAEVGGEVLELVTAHNLLEQVRFNSDNLTTLRTIKDREPRARVGYVTEDLTPDQVPRLAKAGVTYLSPWITNTTHDLVSACHDNGMSVIPWFSADQVLWTPDMSATVDRVAGYGVEGMIVNHPHQVLDKMSRRTQTPIDIHPQQAA